MAVTRPKHVVAELLPYNPVSQGDLGTAKYMDFKQFVGADLARANRAWGMLSKLSAYASGVRVDASIGRGTPRLEPFMFIDKQSGTVPVVGLMKDRERESSFVKLNGLYLYMERRAEIVQHGLGDRLLSSTVEFLNHNIEERTA